MSMYNTYTRLLQRNDNAIFKNISVQIVVSKIISKKLKLKDLNFN